MSKNPDITTHSCLGAVRSFPLPSPFDLLGSRERPSQVYFRFRSMALAFIEMASVPDVVPAHTDATFNPAVHCGLTAQHFQAFAVYSLATATAPRTCTECLQRCSLHRMRPDVAPLANRTETPPLDLFARHRIFIPLASVPEIVRLSRRRPLARVSTVYTQVYFQFLRRVSGQRPYALRVCP